MLYLFLSLTTLRPISSTISISFSPFSNFLSQSPIPISFYLSISLSQYPSISISLYSNIPLFQYPSIPISQYPNFSFSHPSTPPYHLNYQVSNVSCFCFAIYVYFFFLFSASSSSFHVSIPNASTIVANKHTLIFAHIHNIIPPSFFMPSLSFPLPHQPSSKHTNTSGTNDLFTVTAVSTSSSLAIYNT